MRRDVQLFVNKDVEIPPSISSVNLLSDNVLNTEDESEFDFVNHASIDGGKATFKSNLGSDFSMSQDLVDMQPSKKYTLKVGNLEYGPEKLVINRMFNSEQFDQNTWAKLSVTVTANNAVAPDGTTTADRILASNANNYFYDGLTQVANEPIYLSAYVKKDTSSFVALKAFQGGGLALFNLDTGTVEGEYNSISLSSIEKVGNGWYRISTMHTPPYNATGNFGIGNVTNGGAVFVWGFQAEHGNSLSPYVKNTNSTTASYEYVNQTEQQISNYLTYSNDLSNTAWIKSRITSTDGQASYFGDFNGTKLQGSGEPNRLNYTHRTVNLTNKTSNYVVSYYAKRGDSNYISTRFYEFRSAGNLYSQMTVNLNTGAVTNPAGNSTINFTDVEYMSDGWYKVSVGISTILTDAFQILISSKYDNVNWGNADTTAGLPITYISNLQVEENLAQGQYVAAPTSSIVLLSKPNNEIVISDRSDGTGGLSVVHTLTEGTNNLSIPFTTNANTGEIYITSGFGSSTYELSIEQLDLFERLDATIGTSQVSLDLFDFEDINIVDKIKDARDIGKVFTEYSQQFTVPASPKNNELFSHFYNADVLSGYDHRLKHDAVIRIGGADYKHGRISLTSSSIKNGVPYSYSIVFYGSTVTLKDLIGDDILPDLDNTILDALNLEYSATSVKALFQDGLNFDASDSLVAAPSTGLVTPDVFIPFISCDSHYFFDSADQPEVKDRVDSRNVRTGSTQTKKGIYYKDLKLAVKIKYVIRAIEQKYGLTFSDDFFNEGNAAYDELCLFMHRERGGISKQLESSSDSFTLSELAIMPDNGTPVVSDQYEWRGESGSTDNQNTAGWDLDYLSIVDTGRNLQQGFSNPITYSTRIEFDVEVVGAGEYIIEILDFSSGSGNSNNYYWIGGGNTSVSHVFNVGTQGSGANSYANYMFVKPRIKITTQSGISEYTIKDFFLTKMKANTAQVVNPDITNPWTPVIYTDPTLYEYDSELAQTISGQGVGIQAQLPNMKVLDFLTSIFKMFNLTAYLVPKTDVSRYAGQIRVRPLDAFYLGGSEVDITEYVDTSDLIVKRNNIFSSVEYEFEPHKTLAAIRQNERTADIFGSELMNNLNRDLNTPIAFDGGKYKVKASFEKVMYERMTDQSDETTVMNIQWGWMASKDENPVLGKPLLFYPIIEELTGTVDATSSAAVIQFDESVYDKNGDMVTPSHSTLTRYIRPSNSLTGNSQSLNFGSEFDEWYVWEGAGTNENSLFQNYHKNYLLSIYDKQSRLIDLSAYLPVHIVMKLKLEDVVIIKGRKYRINSLKLNITTGEAKMELMNDIAYSKIILNAPELKIGGSDVSGKLYVIYDSLPQNDVVYKLYADGVYQKDFTGNTVYLANALLTSGAHSITARKAKYYDASTFLESEDSNIVSITI